MAEEIQKKNVTDVIKEVYNDGVILGVQGGKAVTYDAKEFLNKDITFGKVEQGDVNVVSGGEVFDKISYINNNCNYTDNTTDKIFSHHIKDVWIKSTYGEDMSKKKFKINYFSYKTYYKEGISIQVSELVNDKWVLVSDFNFKITEWTKNKVLEAKSNYFKLLIQLRHEPKNNINLIEYTDDLLIDKSGISCMQYTDYLKFDNTKYITVGKDKMYSNIQDALDNIKDSIENRITIIVYPGVYPFFKTNNVENRKRYIDIIGLSKRDCIIRDDSGDYYNSPAQMWFDGLVSNMTFFATHDKEITQVSGLKSYALHMDYGASNAKFKNCYFYSEQASAIGIGTYQDDYIEFEDCDVISNIKADYFDFAYLPNYGAMFIHSAVGDNITNQNVVAKKCHFKGSGDYAVYLTCISTQWNFSKDITALLIGNTFANKNNEGKLRMEFKLSNLSHSNNNSNLNIISSLQIK